MSSHDMSLKTVYFCRTVFYLSIVCVKTPSHLRFFSHLNSDLMCNWVASAEKSRSPAVPLLPSGLQPLGRETRASPAFSPAQQRRGRPAALALPPAVHPWSAMEEQRWPPCPQGRCASGATALPVFATEWTGGEKEKYPHRPSHLCFLFYVT